MKLKSIISGMFILLLTLAGSVNLFADKADDILSSYKAKKDKDVIIALQSLVLQSDFTQLDKIRGKQPEIISDKYLTNDFVLKIITQYNVVLFEQAKVDLDPGKSNTNKKGTWQYILWEYRKAYIDYIGTTSTSSRAELSKKMNALEEQLYNAKYASTTESSTVVNVINQINQAILMASLFGVSMDLSDQNQNQSQVDSVNKENSDKAAKVLGYLFNAGVSFPPNLPKVLSLSDWQREVTAFDLYTKANDPQVKSEFESPEEFATRQANWTASNTAIFTTDLTGVPIDLTLKTYVVGEEYFPYSISMDQGNLGQKDRVKVDLSDVDMRYFIPKKNASFFKEKIASTWSAVGVIQAKYPGQFGLKSLKIMVEGQPVEENLIAFRVTEQRKWDNKAVVFDNFLKASTFALNGTSLKDAHVETAVSADGDYILTMSGDIPKTLWQKTISVANQFGDLGPAGGYVFYDKGNNEGGWRYLECAPFDLSTGIQWYNGKYLAVSEAENTIIGYGKTNTSAINSAQGEGNYAAIICVKLELNEFKDWFLPNKDELDLIYKTLAKKGIGSFARENYWSSSQQASYAWYQDFADGDQSYHDYRDFLNKYKVRPVRAF